MIDLLLSANRALRQMLVARGATSTVATIRGHAVHHYRIRGAGRGGPVVLVHGLGGSANGFFKTFFLLARRFSEVIAIDLPGSGFSPLPEAGPLPLMAQLDVLTGFVEDRVDRPPLLVGNSLGAAMCVGLVQARRERIGALALVAPAGARMTPERTAELIALMSVKTATQARELTRRLFHRAPLGPMLFASALRGMYGSVTVQHVLAEVAGIEPLPPEWLSALSLPTLLLWGESEKVLPYEGLDYFRAHLPAHAEVHVVKGFGHIPQMERPAELVQRLVAFADRHRL